MYYDKNRISTNCKSAWFSESGNTDVNMKSPTNNFFLKSQEELQILMNQSHKVAVYAVAMLHCISLPLGAKSNQKYITQTKNLKLLLQDPYNIGQFQAWWDKKVQIYKQL